MKNQLFSGAATALITPFHQDGTIDFDALEILIEFQIQNGISAIVISGTTGEGSTLSFEEFSLLVARANEYIHKRVPLIAGTGTNNTASALKLSLEAQKRGADGLLIVTPYYNKTTQEGLAQHYFTIADRVNIPIILYNVPSRTGIRIDPKTCALLSNHHNIIAIKEASEDIAATMAIATECPDFTIYSGNDNLILPTLVIGGDGVISVLSNIAPKETQKIYTYYKNGEIEKAKNLQLKMLPLINLLFSKPNPIPIKSAVELIGLPAGRPRLPLVACDNDTISKIKIAIKEAELY
jgi:4-hydroxy-tetrahydrodipicolinate synthase